MTPLSHQLPWSPDNRTKMGVCQQVSKHSRPCHKALKNRIGAQKKINLCNFQGIILEKNFFLIFFFYNWLYFYNDSYQRLKISACIHETICRLFSQLLTKECGSFYAVLSTKRPHCISYMDPTLTMFSLLILNHHDSQQLHLSWTNAPTFL